MDELAGLAEAAGTQVVLRVSQERARPDAATFLGRGKLEIACGSVRGGQRRRRDFRSRAVAGAAAADRNLTGLKTVDRTQLILDIFARRAKDARRQVAGRLAPARISPPEARRVEPRVVAAGRRHRHAGPW